jgi:hypothetical protein
VTGGKSVRIPFMSVRGEPDEDDYDVFYVDYFPAGQDRWVGVQGVGTGDILDLEMMVFTKEKIISKFLISDVLRDEGRRNFDFVNPWKLDKQNKQLLRIDTLNNGPVVFDLQKEEFVTGKHLVTQIPIKK